MQIYYPPSSSTWFSRTHSVYIYQFYQQRNVHWLFWFGYINSVTPWNNGIIIASHVLKEAWCLDRILMSTALKWLWKYYENKSRLISGVFQNFNIWHAMQPPRARLFSSKCFKLSFNTNLNNIAVCPLHNIAWRSMLASYIINTIRVWMKPFICYVVSNFH